MGREFPPKIEIVTTLKVRNQTEYEAVTILELKLEYSWSTRSLPWQLMTRFLKSPGHQQPK